MHTPLRLFYAAFAIALVISPLTASAHLQSPHDRDVPSSPMPMAPPRVRLVHGVRSSVWTPQQRADPAARVALTLALHSETSPRALDALVRAVSDVTSPQYGQFLSPQDLARHAAPSPAARDAVQAFVASYHALEAIEMRASAMGDFVTLHMRVATAEQLFATTLIQYMHATDPSVQVVRPHAAGFRVPDAIDHHVLFIDGLESLPTPQQAQFLAHRVQDGDPFAVKSLRDAVSTSDLLVTPAVVRTQYDVPDDPALWNATHPENKIVVAQFLNEYYAEQDLQEFLTAFEPRMAARHNRPSGFQFPHHTGDCVAGVPGSLGTVATGEASLDVQVVVGLSRSETIEMVCFQTLRDPTRDFANDNQEPFLSFLQAVNAMEPPPSVVSISYTDEECAVPSGYRDAVNREFMKAALRGISVIISAGDGGVQGSHMSSSCGIAPCSQFVAMFPASSPYVTTVGATTLDAARLRKNKKYTERVTSARHGDLITSGGGFSAVYAQPAYQKKAVATYLAYADAHNLSSLFPTQGRAYPDLAALGHAFPVYQNGQMWRTDGTSVSAPIIASLVALLNKQRLAKGQSVLGFLNPLIYHLHDVCPHVFEDVTDGEIACGGRGVACCAEGHTAIKGWDAASGVGTLKLATLAQELDRCIAQISTTVLESEPISLLGLQRDTTSVLVVEQIGLVVTLLAAVALFGALASMRGNVFPGRRFFEFQRNEPARERLLAGHD